MHRAPRAAFVLLVTLLAALTVVVSGCRKNTGRVKVAVSISPVYDLVRRVAGPDADVELIVPPGKTPYGFTPSPDDAARAKGAKLGVAVGLGLDPWMTGLLEGDPKARMLRLGDRVPSLALSGGFSPPAPPPRLSSSDAGVEESGAPDPFVWLDPRNAILMTKAIAEELARMDGTHAAGFRERAARTVTSLEALDREVEEKAKGWTARDLVSFAADLGYFAERYHLNVVAVVVPAPGTAPTAAHLAQVRKVVEEKGIKGLLREPQLDSAPVDKLAAETNRPVVTFDPFGGTPGTDTYEAWMRANVAALDRVLR